MEILSYLFWPNPGNVTYDSPKVMLLLIACALLVVTSFTMRLWRRRLRNVVTRKLSASWPTALLWFGVVGLLLVVSRVEGISYLSMRILWFMWAGFFLFFLFLQWRIFCARHYELLPKSTFADPREKYLPRKKH